MFSEYFSKEAYFIELGFQKPYSHKSWEKGTRRSTHISLEHRDILMWKNKAYSYSWGMAAGSMRKGDKEEHRSIRGG